MPLYRGFRKGPPVPPPQESPQEPTRRIVRSETAARPAPDTPPPVVEYASGKVSGVAPALLVGWLVVTGGPGRGTVLPLGYGVNDIGRGPGARVRLDFGDTAIALDNQAAIIYSMRSRRFYLQSVATATLLEGRAVRESVELNGGETLQFGATCLRFVPLCGPAFDWSDNSQG